ncbi:DoxX family protein [Nonomuraea sp. NPDC048916]|uniref:DoxX family protein n=1 Tax=Nonomuraea sp. NPDC048916 TaxID=3154232 RepID=UPI0033DE2A09
MNSLDGISMNVALWIVAGLLALAFLGAGLMKIAQSKEKLAASGMAWTGDFSAGAIKTIGALELLAAIGLILPAALGIVPVLTPLAAVGLVAIMVGAAVTHARRKESQAIVVNLVLLALAAVVAWGRFGPYAF